LPNPFDSSLVGIAFVYFARFRIAQFFFKKDVNIGLVPFNGFDKLGKRPEFVKRKLETNQSYLSRMIQLLEFVNDSSISISRLYEVAVHLAKLEQIERRKISKNEIPNVDYLLFEPTPIEVINDLDILMAILEKNL
jgi:hypothetical protein